ncbi:hypothetical protein KIH87_16930 [Paraneptunicella aestuarii]|uniref:hypothetical protein n=1 Tax=Paraneptunicella aestuarii TaxID=2831148 RepID=UPI001E5885D9|nr:hypothetical protein [Paraneptunicella aestuarii]UAA38349.1 hypothetical protein KIH87_16930 [Paraneptunicella aestuarii]
MSLSVMVIVSLLYIALLFLATMYNHYKGHKDLFISSVFALLMYAAGHLGNMLWLSTLSPDELLKTHYLYFAAMQAILATGLFIINRHKLRVIMSITIALLVVEVLLGYAVHIDRNVIALNGAEAANMSLATSWFLWDMRDYLSQFTTFTVLLALTLPKIYQVKNDDNTVSFSILEAVEAYLEKFSPDSKLRRKAQAYLYYSAQGLCETTGSEADFDHYEVGTMLLNEGIKKCCYEPWRTKPVGFFGRIVYWLRS